MEGGWILRDGGYGGRGFERGDIEGGGILKKGDIEN